MSEIVTRLKAEQKWQDGKGKVVDVEPSVTRVTMAGHSGAGQALSEMTNEAVKAKRGENPVKGARQPRSSALTGDLVIYDAINGSQLDRFKEWTKYVDDWLGRLTDDGVTDEGKQWHLNRARKLRGFTTTTYIDAYMDLDDYINAWFKKNGAKLGKWAACLRTNFALDFVPVSHEELMRGSFAGTPRAPGTGTILQAIRDLHPRATSGPTPAADAQAAEGALRGVEEGPEGEEVTAAAEAIRLPRSGSRRGTAGSTWLESRRVALTLRPGLHPSEQEREQHPPAQPCRMAAFAHLRKRAARRRCRSHLVRRECVAALNGYARSAQTQSCGRDSCRSRGRMTQSSTTK